MLGMEVNVACFKVLSNEDYSEIKWNANLMQ